MMKLTRGQGRIGLQFLLAAIMIFSLSVPRTYAEATYISADSSTAAQISGTSTYLSDSGMIWIGEDTSGSSQIYQKDLSTGEQKQITTVGSPKDSAMIGGHVIVWEDKRDVQSDRYNRDIYSYNLLTGEEKKLNTNLGENVQPITDGTHVIWHDRGTMGDMYVYDVAAGTVKLLGQGRYPMVAKGKAVYLDSLDGGLSLTDIQSGQIKQLLLPTDGSHVDWFTFNGRYVLWKQMDLSHATQYRMMDLEGPNAGVPQDLTQMSKKPREYSQMTIGTGTAAWLEDKNGITQIIGANLKEKETFPITHATSDQRLLNYVGDQLAVRSEDGQVAFRSFVRITESDPALQASYQDDFIQKEISPDGGVVQTKNKEVTLSIPAGALKEASMISIKKNNELKKASALDSSKPLKWASDSWAINWDHSMEQAVTVSLSFDKARIAPNQVRKLALYTYHVESGKWQLSGGVVNSDAATVTVSTKDSGSFAILLNEQTFGDVQRHWAQQMVEILASRNIVDGVDVDQFHPDDQLTRAQFTKMLIGAVGINPAGTGGETFKDVPADYWGHGWIEAAATAGIVEGDGDQFHPDEPLNREQMMTMLIRALRLNGQAQELDEKELASALPFTDAQELSSWARASAGLAVKIGLIQGSGDELLPTSESTRAQAAAVIFRVLVREKLI
jgi:hypothetical protein